MDFKKSKMDFREADRRYAELKRQHDAGTIDDKEFDTQLKEQLMVRDDKNRWWVKSRKTGEWHYNDGSTWVPGTPPGYQPTQTPPTEQPERGRQGFLAKRRWVVGAAIFAVLALLVGIVWYQVQEASAPQTPPLEGGADGEAVQGAGAETVQVPGVLDKPPGEAKEILGSAGFEVKVEPDEWATQWPDGVVVVEQSPLEEETIEKGSTVTVTLDYPVQQDQPDSSY